MTTFSIAATSNGPPEDNGLSPAERNMRPLPLRSEAFRPIASRAIVCSLLFALALMTACGGNSGSSTPAAPPTVPAATAPSIASQPQSQTVAEPAPATFTVQASGTTPLSFQWNKNGTPISGANGASYSTPATSSTDSGATFTVVVTNNAGSVTSNAAMLTVTLEPAVLTALAGNAQSATVFTSFATHLQVSVTDSSGTPVSNQVITFTAPASGASATFADGSTTSSATSDANGIATAPALIANGIGGSYTITASVQGISEPATFSLTNVSSTAGSGIPAFSHVFIVVEENHSYTDVIGSSSMPYLNGLATANSLATQYYADAHPSLPNYFELMVGAGTSITGSAGDSFNGVVTEDNAVRALTAAGKSWKSYAESLPSAGYLGGDSGSYVQRHNPVVYFSDVQQNPAQAANVVPFTQLSADLAANALPDYGFIVPNINDDAHNCPPGMGTCTDDEKLASADQWLSANVGPLLASPAFRNSLLIIVFDEAEDTDTSYGGGHVATILVSTAVRAGYQSTTLYQHESILRVMMEGLGVPDLPGASATAPGMTEFFP